ncbi:MAG TPA: hypothetical protein VMA98_08745 [Candidatus Acidoferrales bacterium]|nr:hypothetical protein [Candidatus Acidoferrales bacterium]
MIRFAAVLALALLLAGAAPVELDSQMVLERYELEMGDLQSPKTMIFTYSVSQLGTSDIEQRHVIYRSGLEVRDETIAIDGIPIKPKIVSFGRREDRYAIARLAPRVASYEMLFLQTVRDGSHWDYRYQLTPLTATGARFVATGLVIDGISYLPREIDFTTSSGSAHGHGTLVYGKSGKYWVPLYVTVEASVGGKAARERIVWGDYRFPRSLPASTFVPPRPLPHATLPPI